MTARGNRQRSEGSELRAVLHERLLQADQQDGTTAFWLAALAGRTPKAGVTRRDLAEEP